MFVDVAVEACDVPFKRQLRLFYRLEIKLYGRPIVRLNICQSQPMAITIKVGYNAHSVQDFRHFESDLETTS